MKNIDIILPVYNEREKIEMVLKEWSDLLRPVSITYSFIICEDGSTDGTKKYLLKLQKKYSIILSQKKYRRGYGRAIIDGLHISTADYILCIDSDGQCDAKDFFKLWNNRHPQKVLIGWRINRADKWYRKLYSGIFKLLFVSLFPTNIHDPSAPFVLFKKSLISEHMTYLTYLREGFWWGFIGMCVKKRIPVKEFPINHRENTVRNTQVYLPANMPSIAIHNCLGLLKLKYSK